MRRGWLLWADWCAATGRTSLHVDEAVLAAFERDVPRARLADIRATLGEVGLTWPRAAAPADPWVVAEQGLAPLDVALRACASGGWPQGYRGRRDAWLLVLTRGLRLSRRAALSVAADRVPDLGLRRGEDSRTCERCVAVRWLSVVEEEWRWGRSAVREMLTDAEPATADTHDCDEPFPTPPAHVVLAPAIDRHGWATGWRPLTPRALTSVLASRCTPGIEGVEAAAAATGRSAGGVGAPGRGSAEHPFDETTFERLDAACAAADAANDRVTGLLKETEEALRGLSVR